jgi:nitrogen fixation negative regulator NifL
VRIQRLPQKNPERHPHFFMNQKAATRTAPAKPSNSLLTAAVEASANGIVITDRWGAILWVNPAFTLMTGYTPAEVLGRNPRILKSDRHPPELYQELWATVMSGRSWHGQTTNRRKDGSEYIEEMTITPFCETPGEITHFIAIKQDVTPRYQAEQELSESERQFRQLAESIPQPVWMAAVTGEWVYCNRRWHEQIGAGPEEWLGSSWAKLLHSEDQEACLGYWRECVQNEREYETEFRLRMRTGEYRWHLARAIPVRDALGHTTRWFGTAIDIHVHKQHENQLEKMNNALVRSNEMLEQFAYVASHDLQEPLRTVSNYVELLGARYRGRLDVTADRFIQAASGAALRMQRLVEDLLLFSRAGRSDRLLVPINLPHVLEGVLKNLTARIEETGATISHSSLPVLTADPGQLSQVLQNLIENALKYRRHDVRPMVDISAEHRELEWVIAVRDNGIGIEPRHFKQIFQLFKRLHRKDNYPGTGIGLPVCQKIVERHGGRIWVESARGQGSTFYFTIPG